MFGDNGSATLCLWVARLMSLTIFSPGLFGVFLIVHSSMITMSQKHSRRKKAICTHRRSRQTGNNSNLLYRILIGQTLSINASICRKFAIISSGSVVCFPFLVIPSLNIALEQFKWEGLKQQFGNFFVQISKTHQCVTKFQKDEHLV